MPLPLNPTNNQTAVLRGVLYTYNSAKGAWTVSTNSEASYTMAAVTATGLVTAGNIKTTSGIFWSNGAPLGGSAGGATNQIQYNSSNSFAGATNFTYTAASGNVVIGATTATSSTTTGALVVAGGAGIAGNVTVGDAINFTGAAPTLTFSASNPTISASSYIYFPGGAYFNSGTVYTEAALRTRGGIINDTGTKILTIGSASQLSVANTTTSTSSSTGALIVSGGVGIAGDTYAGGNLTVGANSFTNTRANLFVYTGILGTASGASIAMVELSNNNGNQSYLRFITNRVAAGSSWTTSSTKIQQRIDVTDQGYIEFNPLGSNYGVDIGNGSSPTIRAFENGNVVITATTTSTSTTTGAMVVKGGVGIAGQVTAGNVMTTSGVFWANGAAFTSGGVAAGTTGSFQYNSSNSFAAANVTFAPANGNVVINSTTTTTSTTTGALVVKGGIGAAGNVYIGGSGYFVGNVYSSYSDTRLKTILGQISNSSDIVNSIETFYYEPNELAISLGVDAGHRQVGVSAQSVQKVMPEAVGPSPLNQEYLTVQYERLVPLLIEAVKELKKEIEDLKSYIRNK